MMTNYMTPTQAQLLGGQMMPLDVTQAQSLNNAAAMGEVPQMSPQMMQQILSGLGKQPQTQAAMGVGTNLTPQFAQGLADPNAPTTVGSGLNFGQGVMGLGNPSGGYQMTPQDLQSFQGITNVS